MRPDNKLSQHKSILCWLCRLSAIAAPWCLRSINKQTQFLRLVFTRGGDRLSETQKEEVRREGRHAW